MWSGISVWSNFPFNLTKIDYKKKKTHKNTQKHKKTHKKTDLDLDFPQKFINEWSLIGPCWLE